MSAITLIMLHSLFVIAEEFQVSHKFYKITNTSFTLWTNRGAITVRNRMQCASQCLTMDRCKAFTFVRKTASCTLGFCAQLSSVARSQTVELYQTELEKCSSSPGFRYWSYGKTVACVWQSTDKLNAAYATMDCAAKGSVLYSMKSLEKLYIARWLGGTYFIGLNDINTEGTFVFDVDDTAIDNNLKTQLFDNSQPDDFNGDEDCVVYEENRQRLNDIPCAWPQNYVCEQLCFVP